MLLGDDSRGQAADQARPGQEHQQAQHAQQRLSLLQLAAPGKLLPICSGH